jgi:hypothetical protein
MVKEKILPTRSKGLRKVKPCCKVHDFGRNRETCKVCAYRREMDPCDHTPMVGGSLVLLDAMLAKAEADSAKVKPKKLLPPRSKKEQLAERIFAIMRNYRKKVLTVSDAVDIRDRVHMACITLGMSDKPITNSKRCCVNFSLRSGTEIDVTFSGEWIVPKLAQRIFTFRLALPGPSPTNIKSQSRKR